MLGEGIRAMLRSKDIRYMARYRSDTSSRRLEMRFRMQGFGRKLLVWHM